MYIEERIQLSNFWKFLLKLQRLIMVGTTVAVILMFGIVVLARYAFHFNVIGYDEIIVVAACWMYFIGGSYAMSEESHIRADVLNLFLSPPKIRFLKIITGVIQVVCGVILIYLSYDMILFDITSKPTTIDWNIPLYIPRVSILVGFIFMTFYSFVYLLRDIHKYKNAKNDRSKLTEQTEQ